jgi:hypothetical protein
MLMIISAFNLPTTAKITEKETPYPHSNQYTTQEFLDITFYAGDYSIINLASDVSEISMEGYGNLLTSGHPMLPSKTFFIGLPPGCKAKSITLLTQQTTKLPGEYQLRTAPSVSPDIEAQHQEENQPDHTSTQSACYPAESYEYLGMSELRKYSVALIRFSPMSYNSDSNTITLYNQITLRVFYVHAKDISNELLSDTAMDDLAAELIYNYQSISIYYQATSPKRQTYDYVIITTSSLVSSLTGFLTWKTSVGFNVNIVTLTWILTNYPASDTQKSIRDFLIANYASWGIKYVLIVGSHAAIPMRTCYPDASNHGTDGIHDIPTDYYYADLTGNWDSDGDGFYGEKGQDNVDFVPEVWLGRIPTDGPAAVSSITLKIQQFEQVAYTGWKRNAMLLGAVYQFANEDNAGNPRWDGAEVMEKCKNNLLSGFSVTTMYETQGFSPCPYTCTMGLTNANIIGQWGSTAGWGIIDWAAHGLPLSASRKFWNTDDGDGIPENNGEIIWPVMIQDTDNGLLNNAQPPIVFAASCLVSHPETGGNLAMSLLISGASAVIGATRTSYGSMGWTQPSHGGHGTVCYDFTNRIANANEDCGHALYSAKYYVYTSYPWNSWHDNANMYNFNLYGDPSMGMNLAPGRPGQPSGPTTGMTGVSYSYSTTAFDPTGDRMKYGWDWNGDGTVDQWDDNNGNYYPSGQPVSLAHVFNAPGSYSIQVKAEDIYGRQGSFSLPLTVLIGQNQPPSKPSKPQGPTTGTTGTSYTYTTNAIDPEGLPVAYGWDWDGDGLVDQWDDNSGNYYPSGQMISTSHTWTQRGTYNIKVKSKDMQGTEGPWSDPLAVTMPFSFDLSLFHLFEKLCYWFPNSFPLLRTVLK